MKMKYKGIGNATYIYANIITLSIIQRLQAQEISLIGLTNRLE